MNESVLYWLWMHKMFGGTVAFKKLLNSYGDAEEIYKALMNGKDYFGIIAHPDVERYGSFTLEDARSVAEDCAANGWDMITYVSDEYPSHLRFIKDPPAMLFAEGKKELLNSAPAIAVVGSRDASDSGRSVAFRTGLYLSSCRILVVSGGADGIDACAHEGAMLAPGGTVAVLGRGLGVRSNKKTEWVSERIRENGLYLTELFPHSEVRAYNFPKRNRLISGMSIATAVIEAGEKSGAIITANLARKQSRRVFAVDPETLESSGCTSLLNSGALPFDCVGDILAYYFDEYPAWRCSTEILEFKLKSDGLVGKMFLRPDLVTKEQYDAYFCRNMFEEAPKEEKEAVQPEAPSSDKKQQAEREEKKEAPEYISDEAKAIYGMLGKEPVYIDEVQLKTGLDTATVMGAVTELEIEALAKLHPGNRVSLR